MVESNEGRTSEKLIYSVRFIELALFVTTWQANEALAFFMFISAFMMIWLGIHLCTNQIIVPNIASWPEQV